MVCPASVQKNHAMSNSRTSFLSETYIESLSRFGVGFFRAQVSPRVGSLRGESPDMRLRACVF